MKMYLLGFAQNNRRPWAIFLWLLRFLEICSIGVIKKLELTRRFIETSRLPVSHEFADSQELPSVEILFVCAGKDIEILPRSIESAIYSCQKHPLDRVRVVVPDHDLDKVKKIDFPMNFKVEVVAESSYLPAELVSRIRDRFGHRTGWVLQQLLKVICVSDSRSAGVLVCDADTILCLQREWFTSDGSQILTPSWEKTQSYYKFLANKEICDRNPKFTFVSHHMLMQPHVMREARARAGWDKLESLVADLIETFDGVNPSPFCIEFELYAQYLTKVYPEKVTLLKWSNLSLPRDSENLLSDKARLYSSVSLHDYL